MYLYYRRKNEIESKSRFEKKKKRDVFLGQIVKLYMGKALKSTLLQAHEFICNTLKKLSKAPNRFGPFKLCLLYLITLIEGISIYF